MRSTRPIDSPHEPHGQASVNQGVAIRSLPAMVKSNDIARIISAHKAFANRLTEGLHWIQSIPIFSLLNPIGSWGQHIVHIKKSEQIVHIFLQYFAFAFKAINRLRVTLHYSLCRRVAASSVWWRRVAICLISGIRGSAAQPSCNHGHLQNQKYAEAGSAHYTSIHTTNYHLTLVGGVVVHVVVVDPLPLISPATSKSSANLLPSSL
jgi:hypothetical protein